MDVPTAPETIADRRHKQRSPKDFIDNGFPSVRSAPAVSVESQLKLRSLYEFVDAGQTALKEIRADLTVFKADPDESARFKGAFERLNRFCLEVDSWGFDEPYRVAHALQRLLMDSEHRTYGRPFWEAFFCGLDMLSALLEQCESNFRWGSAIDDMLARLEPANFC